MVFQHMGYCVLLNQTSTGHLGSPSPSFVFISYAKMNKFVHLYIIIYIDIYIILIYIYIYVKLNVYL